MASSVSEAMMCPIEMNRISVAKYTEMVPKGRKREREMETTKTGL